MAFGYRIQGLVNSLDHGVGAGVIRALLGLALVGALFGLYAVRQFRGLREPAAMECAQLARNLASGRGYTTQCVRPVDGGYLEGRGLRPTGVGPWPELRQAPLYPAVLAAGFRVAQPSFEVGARSAVFEPECTVIVPLGIAASVLTALLLFGLGARLFDVRTGALAVGLFVVSDRVLGLAVSGTAVPLGALLCTGAFSLAQACWRRRYEERPWPAWVGLCFVSALLCGLAVLTGYSLAVLVLPLAMLIAGGSERGRWLALGIFLAGVALVTAPWLARNARACGGPLGMAPFLALRDTILFPADAFERSLHVSLNRLLVFADLKAKFSANLGGIWEGGVRTMGTGLAVCFFLASFFHRFERESANALRWAAAGAVGLLVTLSAVAGPSAARWLSAFFPLVALYGAAFFWDTVNRVEFAEPGWPSAMAWVLAIVTALPAGLALAGPSARAPYPPYHPPLISTVCGFLEPDEMIATDIPWAAAWYGNRAALLLPASPADLAAVRQAGLPVGGVYLTSETGGRAFLDETAWLPVLNRIAPPGFPFAEGIALPAGTSDQLFLTDRVRWPEPPDSGAVAGPSPAR